MLRLFHLFIWTWKSWKQIKYLWFDSDEWKESHFAQPKRKRTAFMVLEDPITDALWIGHTASSKNLQANARYRTTDVNIPESDMFYSQSRSIAKALTANSLNILLLQGAEPEFRKSCTGLFSRFTLPVMLCRLALLPRPKVGDCAIVEIR